MEETSSADPIACTAAPYFGAFYVTKAFLPDVFRRTQVDLRGT
jgi:hypothetical protein